MKNLIKIRKLKKISQKGMSEFLHITQSTYSRYERGVIQPDLETIKKISRYFNVTTDYLLDMVKTPHTPNKVDFSIITKNENDQIKIAEEFEVYLGDRIVTGKELLNLMNTMKQIEKTIGEKVSNETKE